MRKCELVSNKINRYVLESVNFRFKLLSEITQKSSTQRRRRQRGQLGEGEFLPIEANAVVDVNEDV